MSRKRLRPDEVLKMVMEQSDSESEKDEEEATEVDENESEVSDHVVVDDDESDEIDGAESDDDDPESDDDDPESDDDHPVQEYVAKSGKKWRSKPPVYTRRRAHNVVNATPGLTDTSKVVSTMKEIFLLFFPNNILEDICNETNSYAVHKNQRYNATHPNQQRTWTDISIDELCAFMGVLLAAGKIHGRKLHTSQMWRRNGAFQFPLFAASMSRERFKVICSNLRFDDPRTRNERMVRTGDKLEAIRKVVDAFTDACVKSYAPHEILTVDERLATFRGKCPFRMYIKSKPGRYGIKIWICADAQTAYVANLQVYTGMQGGQRETNQGQRVVMDMMRPYLGSGRGVTTDNFFTSVALGQQLLQNNITITGTLRANKADIPAAFQPNNSRTPGSSLFGFTDNETLVSYVPRKKKSVILLSTQHHDSIIAASGKPEIIEHYNATKGGVDTGDALTRQYSCVRQTNRWPFRIFMELLDIAALNSYLIWIDKFPDWQSRNRSRRSQFIEDLSMELVEAHVKDRAAHPTGLKKGVLSSMRMMGYNVAARPDPAQNRAQPCVLQQSKRCAKCPRNADRKTKIACKMCGLPLCKDHRKEDLVYTCINNCAEDSD